MDASEKAARAYVPPATDPASKPSWADVQPGDRVTYTDTAGNQTTFVLPTRRHQTDMDFRDKHFSIIRIERPEYRDVTPQAEPQASASNTHCKFCATWYVLGYKDGTCPYCRPLVPEPLASDEATR